MQKKALDRPGYKKVIIKTNLGTQLNQFRTPAVFYVGLDGIVGRYCDSGVVILFSIYKDNPIGALISNVLCLDGVICVTVYEQCIKAQTTLDRPCLSTAYQQLKTGINEAVKVFNKNVHLIPTIKPLSESIAKVFAGR